LSDISPWHPTSQDKTSAVGNVNENENLVHPGTWKSFSMCKSVYVLVAARKIQEF